MAINNIYDLRIDSVNNNLLYTKPSFTTDFVISTDNLIEGSTNLFYKDSRVDARINLYNSTQGIANTILGTTNQITASNSSGTVTLSLTPSVYITGSMFMGATTNQLVLGTTNTITISSTAPSASRVYTLPDFGANAIIPLSTAGNSLSFTTSANTILTLPTSGTLYGTATGSITSTQLATSLTDETGTGLVVFNNTPTFITPILGVATATSINKLTLTTPTTGATLTLADNSSLITSGAFSTTLTSTATTSVTLPTTGTLATLAGGEILTNKTLTSSTNILGGVTMTLGSDATGDTYYRASGSTLTRLGVGSNGQVLTVSGGLPSWTDAIENAKGFVKDAVSKIAGETLEVDKINLVNITVDTTFTLPTASLAYKGKVLIVKLDNNPNSNLTISGAAYGTVILTKLSDSIIFSCVETNTSGLYDWFDVSKSVDLISQTITNGVTTKSPSEDAVFDALALKEDLITKNALSTPLVWISANGVASFQPLPVLGDLTYYLTNTASDVATYYKQTTTPQVALTSLPFASVTNGQLLATFISEPNNPNRTSIPDGQYLNHLHLGKTGGTKSLQVRVEIWETTSAGVDIVKLADLGPSTLITGSGSTEYIIGYNTVEKTLSAVTSRIATKIYAVVGASGSATSISIFQGNSSDSRSNLPAPVVDATNYVPYTGALNDVDLGSKKITTTDIIVSGATVNTIAHFDTTKNIESLPLATYPDLTELSYVKDVTSAIQTQLNTINSSFIKKDGTTTTTAQIPFALGINSTTDSLINGLTVGKGSGNIATNTVLGNNSLILNVTGAFNTTLGLSSMNNNSSGSYNVGIGTASLYFNTTGSSNIGVGYNALGGNTTGSNNVGIGIGAGSINTTGSYNVLLGHSADVNFNNLTNAIAIGYNAFVNASNTIQLGDNNITNVKTQGTLTLNAVTYPNTDGTANQVLKTNGSGVLSWTTITAGSGTVTSVSVVSANGVSGTVATATTTPAITLTLGAITPSSVNKVTITAPTTSATLTLVDGSSLITSGAFSTTLTSTATTNVILPTTGTLSTLAGTETLTNKRITPRTGTTTSNATPSINTDIVDFYSITAQTVAITGFTMSGTPTNGQKLWISITGTAARAITWGASFEASTIALPTTTVNTTRLDVGFIWNTVTSKWRCVGTC